MHAKRFVYRGTVQGVGFRRRAAKLAADLRAEAPVAGYVRNLDDGTVELHAQGDPEAVARYAERLAALMRANITGIDESAVAPIACDGFEIRR
jgi:acylphosphatase